LSEKINGNEPDNVFSIYQKPKESENKDILEKIKYYSEALIKKCGAKGISCIVRVDTGEESLIGGIQFVETSSKQLVLMSGIAAIPDDDEKGFDSVAEALIEIEERNNQKEDNNE